MKARSERAGQAEAALVGSWVSLPLPDCIGALLVPGVISSRKSSWNLRCSSFSYASVPPTLPSYHLLRSHGNHLI